MRNRSGVFGVMGLFLVLCKDRHQNSSDVNPYNERLMCHVALSDIPLIEGEELNPIDYMPTYVCNTLELTFGVRPSCYYNTSIREQWVIRISARGEHFSCKLHHVSPRTSYLDQRRTEFLDIFCGTDLVVRNDLGMRQIILDSSHLCHPSQKTDAVERNHPGSRRRSTR